MIKSYYSDMDDFPSKFRDMGYYNLLLWPTSFAADKS